MYDLLRECVGKECIFFFDVENLNRYRYDIYAELGLKGKILSVEGNLAKVEVEMSTGRGKKDTKTIVEYINLKHVGKITQMTNEIST